MQLPDAHLDFETGSTVDLRQVGSYPYFEHHSTRVWLFRYRIGRVGPIKAWAPGMPDPVDLLDHIRNGGMVVAHNAAFERGAWRFVRRRYAKFHWPELRIQQQICTMARAAASGLPQSLDQLSDVLGNDHVKDNVGHSLMMKMSKPAKIKVTITGEETYEWHDSPANLIRLGLYCDDDVEAETETDTKLAPLTPHERMVWELDQLINDRGIHVDTAAIMKGVDVVETAKREADKRMRAITNGMVQKCSNVKDIVRWLNAQGIQTETFRKGDHDDIMALGDAAALPHVREVVELRRESSKTSTAKYKKMLGCVCKDDRIRGTLNYHGAGPGRWAGRLIQPQNLPRVDHDTEGPMTEWTTDALAEPMLSIRETYDVICMGVKSPMVALSKSLRGMITAAPGNILFGGDFSNVEGRINAWLSGETWKLEAFTAYDTIVGTDSKGRPVRGGPDLYQLSYSRSFGVPIETVGKGPKRQIGKVSELALGYQGGVGAYVTMGDTYNLKTHELVAPIKAQITAEEWDALAARYASATDKRGLVENEWVAIKTIVQNWRRGHPNLVGSWWHLEDAAVAAVQQPNIPFYVYGDRVAYMSTPGWLFCKLPSGRLIAYCEPHVIVQETELVKIDGKWVNCDLFFPHELDSMREAGAEFWTRNKNVVAFWGIDSETRQWVRKYMYGGLQCENIVQGTARCLMDHAMLRVEDAGYPLILTVHDELLAERAHTAATGFGKLGGSVEEFLALMEQRNEWDTGLPIAATAFMDERYVK